MPPSEATSQYPPLLRAMAAPTTGALRRRLPVDPQNGAPPNEKIPPSEPNRLYPLLRAAGRLQGGIEPWGVVPPALPVSWASWWNIGQDPFPTATDPSDCGISKC